MPHARTRNSRFASRDPSTELSLRIRTEHDDAPVGLDRTEAEDLGKKRTDLTGREVRHGDHMSAREVLLGVPLPDRRRTLLDPEGSEVDPELVRWIPRLGEVLHVDDLAVPHAEATGLVHGDLIRLDLRRPVDVVVPSVPERPARVPLPDVGELVKDI